MSCKIKYYSWTYSYARFARPYSPWHSDGCELDRRWRYISRLGAACPLRACARRFNNRQRNNANLLTRDDQGHWRGFIPGVRDRQRYMFYVVGEGSEGPKRDPYARELETPFPSECIIRTTDFPWHESGYVTPRFHDFVIYQLHVGTFFTPEPAAQRRHVPRCGA